MGQKPNNDKAVSSQKANNDKGESSEKVAAAKKKAEAAEKKAKSVDEKLNKTEAALHKAEAAKKKAAAAVGLLKSTKAQLKGQINKYNEMSKKEKTAKNRGNKADAAKKN